MAGKKLSEPELDEETLALARQLVQDRAERTQYASEPWWECSACGFQNHPRQSHPGWIHCEQCGKKRTDSDPVRRPGA